jgi:hypothetical protein
MCIRRILIYKRTHNGDPDANGCFGVYDCMGSVRGRDFDAVIGIGGLGAEAQANDIAAKINWIGVKPHKTSKRGKRSSEWRGPLVTFDHFRDFGTEGRELRDGALAKRMYLRKARLLMVEMGDREWSEAMEILELAKDAPPSPGRDAILAVSRQSSRCVTKRRTSRCSGPATRLTAPPGATPLPA